MNGKFKERIKQVTKHCMLCGVHVLVPENAYEIVDEARTDFPKKVQRDYRGNPTPKEYETREVDKWREKWLGKKKVELRRD